jgi:hypothetical protein
VRAAVTRVGEGVNAATRSERLRVLLGSGSLGRGEEGVGVLERGRPQRQVGVGPPAEVLVGGGFLLLLEPLR